MIVRSDKGYETNSAFPSTNWYEEEPDNYVVDELTEEGQHLAAKIKEYAPYMELVIVDGKLVDVTLLERSDPPPAPKTPEQLRLDLMQKAIDDLILGGVL